MREDQLHKTEIAGATCEIDHARIADQTEETIQSAGCVTRLGRFGSICYYHLRVDAGLPAKLRILPQAEAEIRLVHLLRGGFAWTTQDQAQTKLSSGEASGMAVPRGSAQEISCLAEGPRELLVLTTTQSDFDLRFPGETNQADLPQAIPISLEQITAIDRFLNPGKPARLKNIFRQIKLAELFVLFLGQADQFNKLPAPDLLRPEETERMRKIRDLLHSCPADSYSLAGLARTFGTNEASLKKNFKTVYGTTIFKYLTARRMELARELLQADQLKIAAVAHEVGYKYASHFTTAFRKHFGVLPKELRP